MGRCTYESRLRGAPIKDIMPLGQNSFSSKLPRRGWVMETVTATCSRVFSPDISRSILLTVGSQAWQLGNQPISTYALISSHHIQRYSCTEATYKHLWYNVDKWNAVMQPSSHLVSGLARETTQPRWYKYPIIHPSKTHLSHTSHIAGTVWDVGNTKRSACSPCLCLQTEKLYA